jgi:hypothetical protein
VLLAVMGAVQDGPSRPFSPSVPPCDAQAWRHEIPHVLAACSQTGPDVVRVVERRGIPRAHQLDTTRAYSRGTGRWQGVPAPGGHPLNPIEGFGRVRQDTSGAGRGGHALSQLSKRTRQGRLAHQERPI